DHNRAVVLDRKGVRLRQVATQPLTPLSKLYKFDSLLAVSFVFAQEWWGRIFLLDPTLGGEREEELRFLQELMQQMKSLDFDSTNFFRFMEDAVERFQRETGIGARFVAEIDQLHMQQRICRELARIVQEALVNVRKHSGAREVLLRMR